MPPEKGCWVDRVAQIRLLSSAVRQDICDTVGAIGPCTVTELARAMGRAADGLYYHVRLLQRGGLLATTESRDAAGRSQVLLDVPGRPMYIRYDPADGKNRAAVNAMVAAMLRSAARDFRRAFHPALAVVSGPRRNLWASRAHALLTQTELEEINGLFQRIVDLFLARRPRSAHKESLYEMTFVLSPAPPRRRGRGIGNSESGIGNRES
jgi:hypothetical protein